MEPRSCDSSRNSSSFFFQAEDGIRDYKVTGVQTCALPISEARLLVPVEATAGLAAVVTRAVTLLDAAWRAILLASGRLVDRRADHECEVDPGEIHEAERSERMAERLLRGEVDLLERGITLVDEEGRLAPERAEQPIRDEALDLFLHQDRPLADALRELDEERRRLRGGVRALHHFDHLHDHRRLEVVEVRDLRWTLGGVRHQARHEGGGVGRKDRPRRAESIEVRPNLFPYRPSPPPPPQAPSPRPPRPPRG